MANGNGVCGEPLTVSGAPLLAPVTTGPISNQTPRLISTIPNDLLTVKAEPPSDALPVTPTLDIGNGACPWWCILIVLAIGYMIVRGNG